MTRPGAGGRATGFPIGVAGCGRMGAPMLANLRRAGFAARGFDIRDTESYGPLAPFVLNDPDKFGEGLATLITVVRDAEQTEALMFGAQNLIARAPDLQTIILSSTLSPRWLTRLRDRVPARIMLIDAPMSGAEIGAREARLTFMLGGPAHVLDRLQPLFAAMGKQFFRMGPFGAGMRAKVLNNLVAAGSTALTRMVLDWAESEGLSERDMLTLMQVSSGQNWFASGFQKLEFARNGYADDNTIGILAKDVDCALDAAPKGAATDLPQAIADTLRAMTPRKG